MPGGVVHSTSEDNNVAGANTEKEEQGEMPPPRGQHSGVPLQGDASSVDMPPTTGDVHVATTDASHTASDLSQQLHNSAAPPRVALAAKPARRGISRFFNAPRPVGGPTAAQLRALLHPAAPTQHAVDDQHHPSQASSAAQTPPHVGGDENAPPLANSRADSTPPMTVLDVFACAAKRSIDGVKGAIASGRGSSGTPHRSQGPSGGSCDGAGVSGGMQSGATKRRKVVGRVAQQFQPPRRVALVLETPLTRGPFARFAMGKERGGGKDREGDEGGETGTAGRDLCNEPA